MKHLFSFFDSSYFYAFLSELTLGFNFLLFILIARSLGPEPYGVFTAANALVSILSVFILFGLPTLLTREIAAKPFKGLKYTTMFLLIQIFNFFALSLLLIPLSRLLGFTGANLIVVCLVFLAGGCRAFKQTLRAVFQGLGQFRSETVAVAIERTAYFLFSTIVLKLTNNLLWVVLAMASVRLADAVALFIYIRRKFKLSSPIAYSKISSSLKTATPFALSGVLWILYYQVDIIMLKTVSSAEETGFYGAAYGLLEIFNALPRVICYVALTKFSRCHADNPTQLPVKIYNSTILVLTTLLPFIIVVGFFQVKLLELVYGSSFLAAAESLLFLIPSLSAKAYSSLIEVIFIARNKEILLPNILLLSVTINIFINFLLIPLYGAKGAAIATFVTEIFYAMAGFYLLCGLDGRALNINLGLVATISLALACIPSFFLIGLNLTISISLILILTAAIFLLMKKHVSLLRDSGFSLS
jgi:O-antigen/teichoic acid export membrane protein